MAAILNFAILNLAILDSTIIVFSLKLTLTCQDYFPTSAHKELHSVILTQLDDCSYLEWWWPSWIQPFCRKRTSLHSFWFNLMMESILKLSAMLDSAILHKTEHLGFILTQIDYLLSDSLKNTLNSATLTLDSDTAILDSNILLSSLRFTQIHSSLNSDWWQPSN